MTHSKRIRASKIINFLLYSIAKKALKPKERRVKNRRTHPESEPANAKPATPMG
jgi:hypothetical protein